MIVLSGNDFKNFNFENGTAVSLGSFDAIHKGHMEIMRKTLDYAKQHNLKSLVYMFIESPKSVISGDKTFINTIEKRLDIIRELGFDYVALDNFTEEYRRILYDEFVHTYIKEYFNAKFVCAGFNYRFGFNGDGNAETLKEMCTKLGIEVCIQDCIRLDNVISASYIKKLIADGMVEKCTSYLGREFSFKGRVIHGNELGRTIGFPTANIEIPKYQITPKQGVYATRTNINGKLYNSITNVGAKPTVDESAFTIETNIFDFDGDIYGNIIEISFIKRLRDIVKFSNINELKKQLINDKLKALNI